MLKRYIIKNLETLKNKSKHIVLFIALSLLLVAVFFLDIAVGSADISLRSFFVSLFGIVEDKTIDYILFDVRIPRAITAIVLGAGLSLSGLLLQTLFHNPLAGPYVLGISSGAGLGVAIYIMAATTFMAVHPTLAAGGQVIAAMLGAGMVFFLVLVFSWRLVDTVSLLIIGIMIGALASSVVGILQYFASAELVHRFVIWSLGSLSSTTWVHLQFIIPVFVISILASIVILKPLDALLMGEIHARVSGVNVKRTRLFMIVISSLLVGILTAFAGPIAFVGMTVPHIVRLLTGKVSFKIVLPGVLLIGPLVMLVCDIISQLPGKATTLPINGVTALFGAPVVILLIVRSRKFKATF
jgi:iron complex transport system permease protein